MEIVKLLWELVLCGLAAVILFAILKTFVLEITAPIRRKRTIKKLHELADSFYEEAKKLQDEIEKETKKETKTKTRNKKEKK